MGVPQTARQLRADDTRARLFAAALRLFTERGYVETTVDEICRRAGVAKGTFFLHFVTKDAVVNELVSFQTAAAERARAQAAVKGSPVDRLRATVLMLGQQASSSRPLSRAVLVATLSSGAAGRRADTLFNRVFELMIKDAAEAQRRGLFARAPEARVIASTLMASYLGAALHFTSSPTPEPLLEILTPIVDANLAGFAVPAKRRRRSHAS